MPCCSGTRTPISAIEIKDFHTLTFRKVLHHAAAEPSPQLLRNIFDLEGHQRSQLGAVRGSLHKAWPQMRQPQEAHTSIPGDLQDFQVIFGLWTYDDKRTGL